MGKKCTWETTACAGLSIAATGIAFFLFFFSRPVSARRSSCSCSQKRRRWALEEESANKFASASFSSGSEGLQKIVLSMLWLWRGRRVWYLRLLRTLYTAWLLPRQPTNPPLPEFLPFEEVRGLRLLLRNSFSSFRLRRRR